MRASGCRYEAKGRRGVALRSRRGDVEGALSPTDHNGPWQGGRPPFGPIDPLFTRLHRHDVRFRSTRCSLLVCVASSLAFLPQSILAQRVLGPGDDATVLRRGIVRVSAEGTWATYNELYGPDGILEGLGVPYSSDTLGAKQLELLRPLQTSLRSLAQMPTADVSLGPVRTDFTARIARSAFVIDFGLTSRIMLTARLPYEHTISEVVQNVNPRDEIGNRANIGFNPARASQSAAATTQNRNVVDSLLRVAQEVAARLDACASSTGDPVCADQTRARTLVNDARAVAAGIAQTYGIGADTARGSQFVPISGSTLQGAIVARVNALNASFKAYVPDLAAFGAPAASLLPLSSVQATSLISDSLGLAAIGLVERSHLGDIELGAKVLLFDSFGGMANARAHRNGVGVRLALGGLARLGTGQAERPNDIVDVGTGDGQTDVEGNGALDIIVGRRFWASFVGRYGVQLADEKEFRIPDVARNPYVPAYREQTVSRDLGDYIQLEATPRFVYNDYLSLSGSWTYRRKAEDTYTGTFTVEDPTGAAVALDASILGIGTEQTEQRVGGGASFSTLRAFDRGRARLPLEVSLMHWQTISGSGYLPKQFSTQLRLRYYTRMFGAPMRPPAGRPAPAR